MKTYARSLLALTVLLSVLPAFATPRVAVDRDIIDIGDVVRGKEALIVFELRNEGSSPLRISGVETTCGCTLASHDEVIAAGARGEVRVTLETNNLMGMNHRGITVSTNDPNRDQVHLTVKANVVGGVERLPAGTLRVSNSRGPMQQQQLLLRKMSSESREMRLEVTGASAQWLEARVRAAGPADGGMSKGLPATRPGDWLLEVRYTGGAPSGKSNEEIRLSTGLEVEPEIVVPVILVVQPPVNLTADELMLNVAPGSAPGVLQGSVRKGLALDDLKVAVEPAGTVDVQLQKTGTRLFRVDIRPVPDRSIAGETHLVFSVGQETHRVPVRVVSSAAAAR